MFMHSYTAKAEKFYFLFFLIRRNFPGVIFGPLRASGCFSHLPVFTCSLHCFSEWSVSKYLKIIHSIVVSALYCYRMSFWVEGWDFRGIGEWNKVANITYPVSKWRNRLSSFLLVVIRKWIWTWFQVRLVLTSNVYWRTLCILHKAVQVGIASSGLGDPISYWSLSSKMGGKQRFSFFFSPSKWGKKSTVPEGEENSYFHISLAERSTCPLGCRAQVLQERELGVWALSSKNNENSCTLTPGDLTSLSIGTSVDTALQKLPAPWKDFKPLLFSNDLRLHGLSVTAAKWSGPDFCSMPELIPCW